MYTHTHTHILYLCISAYYTAAGYVIYDYPESGRLPVMSLRGPRKYGEGVSFYLSRSLSISPALSLSLSFCLCVIGFRDR